MAARITDEEWEKLFPENFETYSLLRAVDAVDELRAGSFPLKDSRSFGERGPA
jgi:hypothetical protein